MLSRATLYLLAALLAALTSACPLDWQALRRGDGGTDIVDVSDAPPPCDGDACPCPAGQHRCSGQCVSNASPMTCGRSCMPCPMAQNATPTCDGTACGQQCNTGFHECRGVCVENSDLMHCGTACTPCPSPPRAQPTCDGARCGFRCDMGFGDCDGDAANGCEADLTTPANCGACGRACNEPTPFCSMSAMGPVCRNNCAPPTGTRCAMTCVDVTSDPAHCGGCGMACTPPMNARATCTDGACGFACNPGFHRCGSACVSDMSTDSCGPTSCTPCPAVPNGMATCDGVACGFACNPGFHACGSMCASNMSVNSCGPTACAPCVAPMNGTATCDGMACGIACNPGFHACGTMCASNLSPATCGTSCTPCMPPPNATATCNGTSCDFVCNAGFMRMGSTCAATCNSCDPRATNVTLPGGRFTGLLDGSSQSMGTCGGGAAGEDIYRVVLTVPSDLFVTTHGSTIDTVVYVRRACCDGMEVGCNNDANGRPQSALGLQNLAPGIYYVYVDGASAAATGAYSVDIYATPSQLRPGEACGNPIRITSVATGSSCAAPGIRANNDASPIGCGSVGAGPDTVYYFVLDATSNVTVDTCTGNTCIDTLVYIRSECTVASSEQQCNDDDPVCRSPGSCYVPEAFLQSNMSVTLPRGVYYLVVDQFEPAPSALPCGGYTVRVTGVPP